MWAAILGFLSALPEILSLVKLFMAWVNQVSGNDPQGFLRQVAESFAKVTAAKTQEERSDAAKAIADLISRT